MGILDIVFLSILALGFISGIQKGLLASFLACLAMAAAWVIGCVTYPSIAEILHGSQLNTWLVANEVMDAASITAIFNTVSFVAVFFIGFAFLLLVVNLFNNLFSLPKLRACDGLLGGVLGIARAAVILLVLLATIQQVFSPVDNGMVNALLDESSLGRLMKDIDILKSI